MKTKTPVGYRAPLKSRAAITAWLLDRAASNPRKGYGMFCYNVKLYHLKTDFAHLCEVARESGELAPDASPRYLAGVEALYDARRDSLWDMATENAAENVVEQTGNRMLWDGPAEEIADWEFAGRSGGWLCLKRFEGVELGAFAPTDLFADASFPWLRNLYRFLIQCDHDFKRPESEVEYLAAFHLFNNIAADIETDKQAAEREAGERKEQAEAAHWAARDSITTP